MPPAAPKRGRRPLRCRARDSIYVAIALSGLTALGAEVVWTRILSLLFGATTYTFSLILAVFLVGLGIGSTLGAELARGSAQPAHRAGLVPASAVRDDRVGGICHRSVAAVLADQSVDLHRDPWHSTSSSI